MAFPASPSNNDVHKEGNRAFVYDSTLGAWDQVREADKTRGDLVTDTVYPAGHIIKTGYKEVTSTSTYNSATPTITPLLIDHVAAQSGSHILITCQINSSFNLSTGTGFIIRKDGADFDWVHKVMESGHQANKATNITFYPTSRGTNYAPDPLPLIIMDDTGAIVKGTTYRYALYMATWDGNYPIYLNRGVSWGTGATAPMLPSTMFLAEIAQ